MERSGTMFKKLALALTLVVFSLTASASDKGTAEEATAMLENTATLYEQEGLEALIAAIGDTSNRTFNDRDLYVFLGTVETDGVLLAHGANPALVGRNLDGLVDANGSAFVLKIKKLARTRGEGWVDYVWTNPSTGKMEAKSTRVIRIGDAYYAAVGIYTG